MIVGPIKVRVKSLGILENIRIIFFLDILKVLIVITDSKPDGDVKEPAQLLRDASVNIFTIGEYGIKWMSVRRLYLNVVV